MQQVKVEGMPSSEISQESSNAGDEEFAGFGVLDSNADSVEMGYNPEEYTDIEAKPTQPLVEVLDVLISDPTFLLSESDESFIRSARQSENHGDSNEANSFINEGLLSLELGYMAKGRTIAEASVLASEALGRCFADTDEVERSAAKDIFLDAVNALHGRDKALGMERRQRYIDHMSTSEYSNLTLEGAAKYYDREVDPSYGYKDISLVHLTGNLPTVNKFTGQKRIDSSFDNGRVNRNSVHFAQNHSVESHSYGGWDSMPFAVVAPLDKMVELNGNPSSVKPIDTWFEARPGEGAMLPEGTILVKPGAGSINRVSDDGSEIAYKNAGFNSKDVDELVETASDYELYEAYRKIPGIDDVVFREDFYYSNPSAGDGRSVEVVLNYEFKQKIADKLHEELEGDTSKLAFLSRLIAVSKAIKLQGRVPQVPLSVMEGGYMDSTLNDKVNKIGFSIHDKGHHSESRVEINRWLPVDSADLTSEQIKGTRVDLLSRISENSVAGLDRMNTNTLLVMRKMGIL